MKNPFKKSKAKEEKGQRTVEAQLQLAEAMNRLADGLDKFQDPLWWQKTVGQSLQTMVQLPIVREALPPGVSVESVVVKLSDEERQNMTQRVYKALQPQLAKVNDLVQESLKELPPNRLKQLAEQIEKGAKLELKRRRGCVFITLDSGEEFHLNL